MSFSRGLKIWFAMHLAIAPAIALANETPDSGNMVPEENLQLTGNEPQFRQDVVGATLPDGTEQRLEILTIRVASDEQEDRAMEMLAQEIADPKTAEGTLDAVTAVLDSERGERIIERINEILPEVSRKDNWIMRLSREFKSKFLSLTEALAEGTRFLRDEVRVERDAVPHFVGVVRGFGNSKVLSTMIFATFLGNPPLGDQFVIPGLVPGFIAEKFGEGLIGNGPAWKAALAAAVVSYLFTTLKHKSSGKNLISRWLSSDPRGPMSAALDKALRAAGMSDSSRLKWIKEFTIFKRYAYSDVVFLGVVVAVLLAEGYPIAASLGTFSAIFAGSVLSGTLTQYNLEGYLAKFQDWLYMVTKNGSAQQALLRIAFFLQMLAVSITATGVTAATFGSAKLWGWVATGALFAIGGGMSYMISRKYNKDKARLDEAAKVMNGEIPKDARSSCVKVVEEQAS